LEEKEQIEKKRKTQRKPHKLFKKKDKINKKKNRKIPHKP
jgi:hypothetical protein